MNAAIIFCCIFRCLDINKPDKNDRTALHWALKQRKFSKARILLKNGAGKNPLNVMYTPID